MKKVDIIKQFIVDWSEHCNKIQSIAIENDEGFQFNENNKKFYHLLLLYFTGNPEFDNYFQTLTGIKGSRNKGLQVVGPLGSGKSFSLETVFKLYTSKFLEGNSYQVFNYSKIIQDYQINGPIELCKFGYDVQSPGGIQKDYTLTLLIDDFLKGGNSATYYGNKIDIADSLIDSRYEAFKRGRKLTHFTTNIYPKQMEEILDARSISRLNEMCNIINLEDHDWRRLK